MSMIDVHLCLFLTLGSIWPNYLKVCDIIEEVT